MISSSYYMKPLSHYSINAEKAITKTDIKQKSINALSDEIQSIVRNNDDLIQFISNRCHNKYHSKDILCTTNSSGKFSKISYLSTLVSKEFQLYLKNLYDTQNNQINVHQKDKKDIYSVKNNKDLQNLVQNYNKKNKMTTTYNICNNAFFCPKGNESSYEILKVVIKNKLNLLDQQNNVSTKYYIDEKYKDQINLNQEYEFYIQEMHKEFSVSGKNIRFYKPENDISAFTTKNTFYIDGQEYNNPLIKNMNNGKINICSTGSFNNKQINISDDVIITTLSDDHPIEWKTLIQQEDITHTTVKEEEPVSSEVPKKLNFWSKIKQSFKNGWKRITKPFSKKKNNNNTVTTTRSYIDIKDLMKAMNDGDIMIYNKSDKSCFYVKDNRIQVLVSKK